MARTEMSLSVRSATLTDDSGGSAIAQIVREVTTDATDPQLAQFVAKFDDGTDEHLFWQFRLPGNFGAVQDSGYPKLHVQFYMADQQATDDKEVGFSARVLAVTPRGAGGSPAGDVDEMTSLDIATDGGGQTTSSTVLNHADPATAGRLYSVSLNLSSIMDAAEAGDYVILQLNRATVTPVAVGDACVVAVVLEYTAA